MEPESNDEIDELMGLWDELALHGGEIDSNSTIFDFTEEDIATSKEPTIAEIAQLALGEEMDTVDEEILENVVEYSGML